MKKKLLVALSFVVCVTALIVGSVAGTLAYLRVTAGVTNTFTYGTVTITMDEAQVDEDGKVVAGGARVVGNRYKLMPGTTYTKDPIIHIGAESQEMFIFLKVDNGIAGLALTDEDKAKLAAINGAENVPQTIQEQLLANGWKIYKNREGHSYANTTTTSTNSIDLIATSTIYYLSVGATVDDTDARVVDGETRDVSTFKEFTTSPSRTTTSTMAVYVNNNATVTITAFAIQSSGEGINDYHDAAAVFATEFASAIPTTP